jgi:hypothetical protein
MRTSGGYATNCVTTTQIYNLITMKNNKYFCKSICLVVLVASLATAAFITDKLQASVPPAVGTYLSSVQSSDWAVMGLSALGQTPTNINFLKTIDGASANDYATYILALTSLGIDPRYYGNENLVESLRQKESLGQIGDNSLLNDDIFGLLALISSGVPASNSLITSEVSYIKNHQLSDGSWDFATTSTAGSVDMTAMGIMALRAAGSGVSDPALIKAVGYLANSQKDDGGWPLLPGGTSNTESTAWVLSALYNLGDNPDFWAPVDASPVDYLLAQIQSDGHAGFDATTQSITGRTPVTTSYTAIALSGKYYPVRALSPLVDINLQIEGNLARICATSTTARTALDAVRSAASSCNYTYHIQDTQYGPYLDVINNEAAAGLLGWSFRVNNESLQVGANDYLVRANDNILLYYGSWDSLPERLRNNQTNAQQSLGLEATITAPAGNPASGSNQPNNSAVVFGVSGDLNFGTLTPGQSTSKTATLTNSGTTSITTTASVSGVDLFKNNLTLDNLSVPSWQKLLTSGASSPVIVTLSVPANYASSGKEQGTLIFWANIVE